MYLKEMRKAIPPYIDPLKFSKLRRKERDFLLALISGKYTKTQLKNKFYIESERTRVRWKAKVTACVGNASLATT